MSDPTSVRLIQGAAPGRTESIMLARRLAAVIDQPAYRYLSRPKLIDLSVGDDVLHRRSPLIDGSPPCYGCGVRPAGHKEWPTSAWCADCQPYSLKPAVFESQCPACHKNLPSLSSFDEHYREAHEDRPVIREKRRTTVAIVRSLTPGPGWPELETLRLCDPDHRNLYLSEDLGVPSHGSWGYPSVGSATVTVRGQVYEVTWKRNQAGTADCSICGDSWQYEEAPPLELARLARIARLRGTVPAGLTPRRPGDPLPGARK